MTIHPSAIPGAFRPADEAEIVRSAQRGDTSAQDNLARTCQRTAFIFALQLTGNAEDAKDVAQDAMLRFFNALQRLDPSRPVRPWLLRIVRNLVYDRFRRSRIRKVESLEPAGDALVREPADTSADPEALAARHELQVLLWQGVQRLPAAQREVLVLRDYQDLSYSEISKILGIALGTVMSRLHRARTRLRQEIAGAHGPSKEVGHD